MKTIENATIDHVSPKIGPGGEIAAHRLAHHAEPDEAEGGARRHRVKAAAEAPAMRPKTAPDINPVPPG